MKNKSNTALFRVLMLFFCLGVIFPTIALAQPPGTVSQEGLFIPSPLQGDLRSTQDPTIMRSRFVQINFPLLNAQADTPAAERSAVQKTLPLNLFPELFLTAILSRVEMKDNGLIWVGYLDGIPFSTVILVTENDIMSGNISLPGGFYQVRYAGNGVHAVYQINQAAFPPEAEPRPIETAPTESAEPLSESLPDNGSQIDIMVVYTPAMRSASGGTAAVNTLINLAVTETNTSYANSGIIQRLRLVHTAEVSYTESGNMGTDLDRLTNTSDGYMDNVHGLRNTYRADLVQLLIEGLSTDSCGIAWMMANVSPAFGANGFSVVRRGCATGNYSFGHEFGHNMGARHDWYVDTQTTPYAYSHAFYNTTDRWRTVMAYNDGCTAAGVSCTRIPYWSNPDVLYGGDPMGIPEGSYHAADNRKTLNNTAYTVANFRTAIMPTGNRLHLPLILKTGGPTPGFWQSAAGGTRFYVSPDRANVLNFKITVTLENCGIYDIWKTTPVPIAGSQFSFTGGLYASGTFDSPTAAHGTTGLNSIGPICGYYWTGGPWSWSATWQNSSQPDSPAADQDGLGFEKAGANVPGTFTAVPLR